MLFMFCHPFISQEPRERTPPLTGRRGDNHKIETRGFGLPERRREIPARLPQPGKTGLAGEEEIIMAGMQPRGIPLSMSIDEIEELREKIETFLLEHPRLVLQEPGRELLDLAACRYSLSTEYG